MPAFSARWSSRSSSWPVRRVGALSAPIAYCPDLEEAILPQTADVLKAIRDIAKY